MGIAEVGEANGLAMLVQPVAAGCPNSDPDDEEDDEGGCAGVVGGQSG